MLNFRKALLNWLLLGTPPDLWSIDRMNTSIIDCEPLPLKHRNELGGPWWTSPLETLGELLIQLNIGVITSITFHKKNAGHLPIFYLDVFKIFVLNNM
jgi:hypothetical protein